MKNCGQTTVPETDNTSPCDEFLYSECIVINRKSSLIRGAKGMTGNEYLDALEGEIRRLKLELKTNNSIIQQLKDIIPTGIGTFQS